MTEYFIDHAGEILANQDDSYQTNTIFLFSIDKNYLPRNNWNSRRINHGNRYKIESTFKEKIFIKKKINRTIATPWHPGINLLTFCKLQGIYPSNTIIRELLNPLKYIEHNDLCVHYYLYADF